MIDKLIEQQETIKGMQENEESAIKIMKMYEDYKLRVDKAIEYLNQPYRDNFDYSRAELLDILKGDNKKTTVEITDDNGNKKEVNFEIVELKDGEYLKKINGKWYIHKNNKEEIVICLKGDEK